jgi:hydrogenase/urease accessory protein HupE
VGRIARTTLAFTLGHSITLALGALGVPVPQQAVEVLIAVSILVAAVHAVRPLFAGREALVAGGFGLVHGLAFSATLRDLDLSGARLVLSLLGFNLGIELMQLVVVALVLPPLVLLARATRYREGPTVAATLVGVAAVGWVLARLGAANPVADLADRLGTVALPVVVVLWFVALWGVAPVGARSGRAASASRPDPRPASSGSAAATTPATPG